MPTFSRSRDGCEISAYDARFLVVARIWAFDW
jgi:hypothetical protein